MNENRLICDIERRIRANYEAWTVGVTNDPIRREREFAADGQRTVWWQDWTAESEATARAVADFFARKGCLLAPDGAPNSVHVYIC